SPAIPILAGDLSRAEEHGDPLYGPQGIKVGGRELLPTAARLADVYTQSGEPFLHRLFCSSLRSGCARRLGEASLDSQTEQAGASHGRRAAFSSSEYIFVSPGAVGVLAREKPLGN